MRIPNLNTLRAFDAAARHLNFRLAGEELLVTQSAIAQQVRRLEDDLGIPLFHRHPRGLRLTEAGRRYHRPLRKALALIEAATEDLRPNDRVVVLSVPPTLASRWLLPRLAGFEMAHPDIALQVVATEDRANFRGDGVTLAVRQGPDPAGGDLSARLLAPIRLMAVAAPDAARRIGCIADPSDLADWPLIQDSHRYWDAVLDRPGHAARRQQFNQTALCLDAAAKGRGLAIAPSLVVADDIAEGRLCPVWTWDATDSTGFYLIHPADRPPDRAARAVIDWLARAAAATLETA